MLFREYSTGMSDRPQTVEIYFLYQKHKRDIIYSGIVSKVRLNILSRKLIFQTLNIFLRWTRNKSQQLKADLKEKPSYDYFLPRNRFKTFKTKHFSMIKYSGYNRGYFLTDAGKLWQLSTPTSANHTSQVTSPLCQLPLIQCYGCVIHLFKSQPPVKYSRHGGLQNAFPA